MPVLPARAANPASTRDHNRRLVLSQLHSGGALGRAEIARRAGLTTQAACNIIAELESEGLLRAEGAAKGRRGLPAMQYAVNPEGGYALGIELRPAAILAALLDLSGEAVWQGRRALSHAGPAEVAALLPGIAGDAARAVPGAGARLLGAGVVMPGPFGRTALPRGETDLPGWEAIDPAAHVEAALGLPVIVENDANAAAMAEGMSGAAQGLSSFACLYFGTGLGLGIVSEGRLVRGAFGNAGEIGHVVVAGPDGPARLETLLSRAAVERATGAQGFDALERLHGRGGLSGWLSRAAPALTQALSIAENLLDPSAMVLCGAMPAPILRDLTQRAPLPPSVSRRGEAEAPVRIGTCSGLVAARGAAALVLSDRLTPALAA